MRWGVPVEGGGAPPPPLLSICVRILSNPPPLLSDPFGLAQIPGTSKQLLHALCSGCSCFFANGARRGIIPAAASQQRPMHGLLGLLVGRSVHFYTRSASNVPRPQTRSGVYGAGLSSVVGLKAS